MKSSSRGRGRPTPGLSNGIRRARATTVGELFKDDTVFLQTHDLEGNLLSVNDAACRALGSSASELIGRSIRELLVPEYRAEFSDYLSRLRRSGCAAGVMAVLTRTGEIRHWHYQNVLRSEGPTGQIAQGTAIDVTDLIAAEKGATKALRDSEERYRLLFERNLAGMYRSMADGTLLDCNDAFARILGFSSRAEVLARNAATFYHYESDRKALVDELAAAGVVTGRETCLRRKDGQPVWVLDNLTLVPSARGQPAMFEGSMIDISDRRNAEDALRLSEERYRFLFERNPLPMWIYEMDSLRFLDVNEAALSHYGYSRAEMLGMSLPDLWPPEDRRDHPIAESAQSPQPFTSSRHVRRDGSIADVEVSAVDVPGGRARRRLALARDVTKRKAAERALFESERKYRHIFMLAPVGIYQLRIDGKYLTVNPAFARIFGYTPEELIAHHTAHDLYFQPEDRDEFLREFVKSGKTDTSPVRRLKSKTGEPVWVQSTAQIIRSDDGAVQYIEGFSFDVTEKHRVDEQQKRLQDAVLETARQWRDTFDAIDTPVLVVDENALVKRLNRAAVKITGQTYVDVLDRPLDALAAGEVWKTAASLVRSPDSERSRSGILSHDEGAQKVWEISVSGYRSPGSQELPLSIVILRDITAIVKLQESVLRAESMSSMGSLVAGVAHEVRNPLFAISATLDAFDARFRERDDYKKYAQALRAQLDRMNHLMRDLLDYGRPAVLELRDVPPGELVHDAVRGCSDLATRNEVSVRVAASETLPPVRVDRGRVVQVFINLLENAIQHSPQNEAITVTVEELFREDARGAHFTVEDRGPGFQAADLPKLFDPFFTKRQGGTGLGLAIVQKIIAEHGGTITPANRPDGGARVSVWIPCAPPEAGENGRTT
ncbi:MAG: PAS domain S-box protein [Thermoanaerobaculia bacterium]